MQGEEDMPTAHRWVVRDLASLFAYRTRRAPLVKLDLVILQLIRRVLALAMDVVQFSPEGGGEGGERRRAHELRSSSSRRGRESRPCTSTAVVCNTMHTAT